jgi:hypothetical protein
MDGARARATRTTTTRRWGGADATIKSR